jgi:diguanylate cyclase (GGDEF)-like protein
VLFDERLRQALDRLPRSKASLAVFIIDLDHFKEVNDTHGHSVGDELIRSTAERLSKVCRSHETVARLGGDEFAVVAPDLDAAGAAAMAERLLQALGEPVLLSCGSMFSGASLGVAVVDPCETYISAEETARRADVALYRAKERGRGRFCIFETEMDAALKRRRLLEQDLRQALLQDDIHLAYQPQVNARGILIGVEALARWTHPEQGPVSPGFFIPLAEDCGLIEDLGQRVLVKAMRDSLRWPALQVAINVSATQLRRPGFTETVQDLLAETGAHARQIELEITEGVLLGDDETTRKALVELRRMGFSLALDDFGTGYSSLSYLRRYPIDKIKIDRSFITPLGDDLEAAAVVGAIVRLARALRLTVIAEGVETEVQREILRGCGCGQSQGFLFSPAVSSEAIDRLVELGRRPMPLFDPPLPSPSHDAAPAAAASDLTTI